jgi:purine-binding chemotaxis protein CheW
MLEEKYVIFRLGNEAYSMNIDYVRAIEQQYSIIPLPEAQNHVKGMINLRGEIIPVYSLRSRFHMGEVERTKDSQLLIAKAGNIQLAFEVDAVMGIETIAEQQKKEIPTIVRGEATNYIGGILEVQGRIVVEISIKNIMTESEWEDIEEFIQQNG